MTHAGMFGNTQSLHYNDTSGKTMDLLGWCKAQGKLNLNCSAVMQAAYSIKNYRNTLDILCNISIWSFNLIEQRFKRTYI